MTEVTRTLRDLLRGLREDFPVKRLRVTRRRIPQPIDGNEYAYAIKTKRGFTIVIHQTIGTPLMIELLLHEYAHVLCWGVNPTHGATWAATYAKLRRWFQEEGEWSQT